MVPSLGTERPERAHSQRPNCSTLCGAPRCVELMAPELPKSPPPELPEDARSIGEAMGFASGLDLSSRQQMNRLNELTREDGVQLHVHRVKICGVYVAAAAAMLMFGALVAHYVFPEHVLTADQAEDLQKFLFSGAIGGLVTKGVGSSRSRKEE